MTSEEWDILFLFAGKLNLQCLLLYNFNRRGIKWIIQLLI